MRIPQDVLVSAIDELATSKSGRKDDYFAVTWLSRQFNLSTADAQARLLSGAAGLDAHHLDRDTRNLYLYVFRWSASARELVNPLRQLAEGGLDQLFALDAPADATPALHALRRVLFEQQALFDRVYVVAVFNGDIEGIEKSVTLRDLQEQLESKRHVLDAFFQGSPRALVVDFCSALTGQFRSSGPTRTHTYELELGQRITQRLPAAAGRTVELTMGFVSLYDLHLMHQQMKHRLFERNIRAGLSADRPPNKAIREALAAIVLEGKRPPESFAFHHNGVTIAAQKLDFEGDKARLAEPRVLNGAQTITSFGKFMADLVTPEILTLRKHVLQAIRVPARIVTGASPDIVVEVTLNTNRQNPVEPWNLRASDPIQLELQDKFRDELGLFYERQEGALDPNAEEQEEAADKPIQLRRLAQALLAVQGQVARMHKLPEVFESRHLYEETFTRSLLSADARKLVLVYKVQKRLSRALRALSDKSQKLDFLRGPGRNLVWALLSQALLNAKDLDDLLEEHGRSLSVGNAFNDRLVALAETPVRMVIQDALKEGRYKEFVDGESYSFLRTTEFCTRCLDAASDRYSWHRRTLTR